MQPIDNEADYLAALARADVLMEAAPGTPEEEELDALADALVAYEEALGWDRPDQ